METTVNLDNIKRAIEDNTMLEIERVMPPFRGIVRAFCKPSICDFIEFSKLEAIRQETGASEGSIVIAANANKPGKSDIGIYLNY